MTAQGAARRLHEFNHVHESRQLPYYNVLGVPVDASKSDIVRAYRKLSLRFHPDKPGGSNERFQELSKAYTCLSNEDSRRRYDECGFDEDNISTAEVDQFVDAFFGEGARNVDGRSPDWSMGKVENYVRIDLADVPLHMRDIVRLGLKYIVSLEHQFENVVLLQHARVDILYLMVGLVNDTILTQEVFESEASYTITYYDNPLQPGICPRWSDQNQLSGRKVQPDRPRRELNMEEFQRRQKIALAMLQNGPADPMAALEEKYRSKMLAQQHAAAVQDWSSLREQDVYEEDAELDCNRYADLLSQSKAPEAAQSCQQESQQSPTTHDDDVQILVREDQMQNKAAGTPQDFHMCSERMSIFSCMKGCLPEQLWEILSKSRV